MNSWNVSKCSQLHVNHLPCTCLIICDKQSSDVKLNENKLYLFYNFRTRFKQTAVTKATVTKNISDESTMSSGGGA